MSLLSAERHLALVDWSYLLQVDEVIAKLGQHATRRRRPSPRADINWIPLWEHGVKITDKLLKNPGE